MAQENWTLEMDGPGPKVGRVEWVLFEPPPTQPKKPSLSFSPKNKSTTTIIGRREEGQTKQDFFRTTCWPVAIINDNK